MRTRVTLCALLALCAGATALAQTAQAPQVPISGLPLATIPLNPNDQFSVVQGGTTKRVGAANVGGAGVSTFNSRFGSVSLEPTDISGAGGLLPANLPFVTPAIDNTGATDVTLALEFAMAGAPVRPLSGVYQVCDLIWPNGGIFQGPGGRAIHGLNAFTSGMAVNFYANPTCANKPLFDVSQVTTTFKISGVYINCNGQSGVDAIGGGSTNGIVDEVTIDNCQNDIGGTEGAGVTSRMRLTRSFLWGATNAGIYNPRDLFASDSELSLDNVGIFLNSTVSGLQLSNTRVEFSTTYGLECSAACTNASIIGGIFDSNADAGFYCTGGGDHVQFAGTLFYRNAQAASSPNDSDLYIDGCQYISGYISTKIGANDGGGGIQRPNYVVRFGTDGLTDNIFLSGDLNGSLVSMFAGTRPAHFKMDNGYAVSASQLLYAANGTALTSDATVGPAFQVQQCNATSGAVHITVPAGSTEADAEYQFVKTDSSGNACVLKLTSGDTFLDGTTSISTSYPGAKLVAKNLAGSTSWSKAPVTPIPVVESASVTQAAASTEYYPCSGTLQNAVVGTESNIWNYWPVAGIFRNFEGVVGVAPGAGQTDIFTLRTNGTNSSVTCTVSGASATSCTDTAHTAAVALGQTCSVQVFFSSGAATARVFSTEEFDSQY